MVAIRRLTDMDATRKIVGDTDTFWKHEIAGQMNIIQFRQAGRKLDTGREFNTTER